MKTQILNTIPVLPTSDIQRDIDWYKKRMGLEVYFSDNLYAILYRDNLCLHLQWHAGTEDDPMLGGSVVRIYVKNIQPLFEEFLQRGTVIMDKFKTNTPWNTNEFGFYDLNNNALFIMEDAITDNKHIKSEQMSSLLLRNLIFTILQPGIVIGLIPYLIAKQDFTNSFYSKFEHIQYLGIGFFAFGIIITLYCILEFAFKGSGTLSPADPTKKLVISGLYRYSRNPMYVGVLVSLIGEVIFIKSFCLLLYSLVIFVAFYLFIIFKEEPRLLKDFGKEYESYKDKVGRWI